MRLVITVMAAAFALCACAQDSGLLLGVQGRDGQDATVWVGTKGVAAFARKVGDGYWLWKDGGFWRVIQQRTAGADGTNTVKITDATGKETMIKGEEGRPLTSYGVMYVSDFGIGLMQSMHKAASEVIARTGTGGGVFGNGYAVFPSVYKNFLWSAIGTSVEIGTAFGEATSAEFDRDAKAESAKSGHNGMDNEASPTNWSLSREKGRWQLKGLLLPAQGAEFGGLFEFEVATIADKRFGSGNLTGPNWARVKSEYPDAIDFAVSPDGKVTVVVTPEEVFVHASSGSSFGRRIQRLRVDAQRVVMTQWLEGDAVQKAASAVGKH